MTAIAVAPTWQAREARGVRWLKGLAVPYGAEAVITTPGGSFVETVSPGCFRRSIQAAGPHRLPLLGQHDSRRFPIGSAASWRETSEGLWATWTLANTAEAREVYRLVREGHLSSLSVGFLPIVSDWTLSEGHGLDRVRRVEARLLEVSVVSVGAYVAARVTESGDIPSPANVPHPGPLGAAGRGMSPRLDDWRRQLARLRTGGA